MSFLELLRVYKFDNKIRCGVNKDGGYVIGDINDESGYDCYISAGVNNEESFSKDFIKNMVSVKTIVLLLTERLKNIHLDILKKYNL
jgi:hypothetical protein